MLDRGDDKILAVYRGGLMFVFNFHPTRSAVNVRVPVNRDGNYTVEFSTDDWRYGGYGQIYHMSYPTKTEDSSHYIELYLPARTAVVLREYPHT